MNLWRQVGVASLVVWAVVAAGAALAQGGAGADWPTYRGPNHDGISAEKGWKAQWPEGQKPKQLWKLSVGTGASAVAVVGGKLYTMGNVKDQDIVYCLDAATGAEVWKHAYACKLNPRSFEGGPGATPTIDGDRVYTLSHEGHLYCLNAADGKPVWMKHLVKDFNGKLPRWNYAGSPLIDGDLVIVDAGGPGASTVALDKKTGDVKWQKGDDIAGYGTPIIGTIDGKRTLVVFKGRAVVGMSPADGAEYWRYPWVTSYDVNAATPILTGDKVFISSGYNRGCALLEIKGGKANVLWENKNMRNHVNSCVLWEGHVYGFDGQVNDARRTGLACVRLADGKQVWRQERMPSGGLMIADGKLIALDEKGQLSIAPASPAGFTPMAQFQAIDGHCWVVPVLAGGKLYVRSNQGELVCYEMK